MEPLIVEFDVDASVEHAFDVWTAQPSIWWPPSHTITKDAEAEIVFERFVGGRVYERGSDGEEHDWGEILEWKPPERLSYMWHLFFARSEATEVAVTFTDTGARTSVRIEQTGFERLGEPAGTERRTRTELAWTSIARIYADAL